MGSWLTPGLKEYNPISLYKCNQIRRGRNRQPAGEESVIKQAGEATAQSGRRNFPGCWLELQRHRSDEDLQPGPPSSGRHHHVLHSTGCTPGDPGGFLSGTHPRRRPVQHQIGALGRAPASPHALPRAPRPTWTTPPGLEHQLRHSGDLHGAEGG